MICNRLAISASMPWSVMASGIGLTAAPGNRAPAIFEGDVNTVEDVDTAIAQGPGLRWALLGPFLNLHLSGGAGGIARVLEHLGPSALKCT